ncbi:MAG: caspase family protein [Candidatus Aminicenantes bacterium]|jgi:hypothetical protein
MSYDKIRIQGFLAERVDLHDFCFILQFKVHPRYAYRNLAGDTPAAKSRNLVMEASMYEEVGDIVSQLVMYWLDNVHGSPIVLAKEQIHKELEILIKELEEQGEHDRTREIQEKLEQIRASLPQPGINDIETGEFPHGYAVLVGVGEYRNPSIPPLFATVNDVQAIHEVLIDPGRCGYLEKNMHVLTGLAATQQSILESLDWLAEMSRQDPDATAIFYFSGHGWKDEDSGSSRYFLIPYDCDWNRVESTTIGDELFTEKLRAIETSRLAVIVDSCHAGGMAMTKELAPLPKGFVKAPPPISILEYLGSGSGKVILSSARENELSYIRNDHSRSIFTHCLIEALSGKEFSSPTGKIGIIDVFTYLDRHVPAAIEIGQYKDPRTGEPAQQHPILDTKKANNFPIALVPGRKSKSLI